MSSTPERPTNDAPVDEPAAEYEAPAVEDIDTTYGPAETSAGVPPSSF